MFVRRDNLKCRICKNCTFPCQRWNCGCKKRRWCSFSEALQRHCYLLLLLPTNAATCDGPHSSRVIGPCSQSPSNQRRAPGLWGKPPQYGVTGGSDRQTGQRVMLESQAFLSIHLRATDTAVKLDTNTTTQGRNSERDQERVLLPPKLQRRGLVF